MDLLKILSSSRDRQQNSGEKKLVNAGAAE